MVRVNTINVSNELLQNLSTRNIQHLDMNYCPVVNNIMIGSFADNQNIVSVSNINENITEMRQIEGGMWGQGVFWNCSNLTTPPNMSNLTSLTEAPFVFYDCHNLTDMPVLSNSIINACSMFYNCNSLVNVTDIPDSVIDMTQMFSHCNSMINAPRVSNSVTSLTDTFFECFSLVNGPDLTNANNLLNMWRTFYSCNNLTNIAVIPNSVTNASSTFEYCFNLVNAPVIPNSVTDMSLMFHGCFNLVNANTISNSVVNMRSTYNDCYALVNIPSEIPSVTEDMRSAFCNCWNITSTPDMSNATNLTDIAGAYWNCVNLTTVSNIPANITDMGWCFEYCNNISSDIIIQSEKVFEATGAVYGNNINVYIPFNMSSSLDYTQWYCWLDGNDNKYYIPVDFYNMSQGSGWMVYNEDIRDENFNWISGDIQYNGEYYIIHVWGEQYIETEINYSSANNVVLHKNAGDSSFTYDSFVNAGYSTSDYVNGVILKDLSSL